MIFELFSEGRILLWIQANLRNDFLNAFFIPFTHLGDIGIIWFGLGIFFLLFKNTRKGAFFALISFGLSALIGDGFLKLIVNRLRPFDAIPELMALVERPNGTSFPSGHTTTAFGFSVAFLLNTKKDGQAGLFLLSLYSWAFHDFTLVYTILLMLQQDLLLDQLLHVLLLLWEIKS